MTLPNLASTTEALPVSAARAALAFTPPTMSGDRFAAYIRGGTGDPTLVIRVSCPACRSDARTFDTATRRFGCLVCAYTSDERNA